MMNRMKSLSVAVLCLLAAGVSLAALAKALAEDDQHGPVIVTGGSSTVIIDGHVTGVEAPDPDFAQPDGPNPLIASCITNTVVDLYGGAGVTWIVPPGFTNCATSANGGSTYTDAGCFFGTGPCATITGGYTLEWQGTSQTSNQVVGYVEIFNNTGVCSNCTLGTLVEFKVPRGDTNATFRAYLTGLNVPPGCPGIDVCVTGSGSGSGQN